MLCLASACTMRAASVAATGCVDGLNACVILALGAAHSVDPVVVPKLYHLQTLRRNNALFVALSLVVK